MKSDGLTTALWKPCTRLSSILGILLLFDSPAVAAQITFSPVVFEAAVDDGPEDGIFDAFVDASQVGSVNDNGFTSFRTAFEFSLEGIPVESTINSATLMFRLQNSEGTRGVRVDGYAGDGAPNLTDFGLDNLLGSVSIGPDPFFPVNLDTTNFVSALFANGDGFAGFDVREDPANTSNFLVMFLDPRFVSLSVDYTAPAPVPEPASLTLLGLGIAGMGARRYRQRKMS
jgi:PEP-CTERM motif